MISKVPNKNPLTPEVYKKVRGGSGTPAEVTLVHDALGDPKSPLHQWMEGVPDWIKHQFALRLEAPDFGKGRGSVTHQYDKAFDYTMAHFDDKTFSPDDLRQIFSKNIPDNIPRTSGVLSSYQYNAVSSAMKVNMRDLRPKLADELLALTPQGGVRKK